MNKLKYIPFTIVIIISSLLFSCTKPLQSEGGNKTKSSSKNDGYVNATIVRSDLDGCSWIVELEDGKKLQPISLTPEFQKDKLKVRIKYFINKDGMSICMVGEMINVLDIKLR